MDWYDSVKWLHILGSTVLFGTGAGTAFQMVMAMRDGDPHVVATVARNVVIADWVFTTPAGIIQPITGITLVYLTGISLAEPWLLLVYALYTRAFIAWVPVVWLQTSPQNRPLRACRCAPKRGPITAYGSPLDGPPSLLCWRSSG